jgi:hypothetical protein
MAVFAIFLDVLPVHFSDMPDWIARLFNGEEGRPQEIYVFAGKVARGRDCFLELDDHDPAPGARGSKFGALRNKASGTSRFDRSEFASK